MDFLSCYSSLYKRQCFRKLCCIRGENVKTFQRLKSCGCWNHLNLSQSPRRWKQNVIPKSRNKLFIPHGVITHKITILYVTSCCRRTRGLLESSHVFLTTGWQDGGAQRERGRRNRHSRWAAWQPAHAGVKMALATAPRDSSHGKVSLWQRHWETQAVNIGRQYTDDSPDRTVKFQRHYWETQMLG